MADDLKSLEERIKGLPGELAPYKVRVLSYYANKEFADMIENKKIDQKKVVNAAENMIKDLVEMYLKHSKYDESERKKLLSDPKKVESMGFYVFGITPGQLAEELGKNVYNPDQVHNLISEIINKYGNKNVSLELSSFTKNKENKEKMKKYIITELENNNFKVEHPNMLDRTEELHSTYMDLIQGVHKNNKPAYAQSKQYITYFKEGKK